VSEPLRNLTPSTKRSARWLGALGVAGLAVASIYFLELLLGFRSPVFAFTMHFTLMTGAVYMDILLAPKLTSRRFDVSPREIRIYRRLGVVVFMRLLQRIGWHRAMRDPKVFDGTRRTLASYERATRYGENAHAWIFAVVLAPTAWAIAHGWWDAAFWLSSMSVVLHVYPVMLQRTQRARLVELLGRREGSAGTDLPGGLPANRPGLSIGEPPRQAESP
jgi:hypothetical protein